MANGRRTGNKPWKHIYGTDRKYTARVDRLRSRREWAAGERESREDVASGDFVVFTDAAPAVAWLTEEPL